MDDENKSGISERMTALGGWAAGIVAARYVKKEYADYHNYLLAGLFPYLAAGAERQYSALLTGVGLGMASSAACDMADEYVLPMILPEDQPGNGE